MANRGGARQGAGRKPLHDDIKARDLCIQAIESNFGSLLEGLQALLRSGEPTLIKFVYEHALGKPKERIESDINSVVEQIQIIQLPDNNRGDIDIIQLPDNNRGDIDIDTNRPSAN